MSMTNFALSNCQRPAPRVNVARSVPRPYSTPMTVTARIMMGMTKIMGSCPVVRLRLNGRGEPARACAA